MNNLLERMVKELPQSPTLLTKKSIKKIHRIIPVPRGYEILWADIVSMRGYPAGIVLTDKALIVKASKAEMKKNKKTLKKSKNGEKKKEKAPKEIYRIIPWEYYNPEEYEIKRIKSNKKDRYVLSAGDLEIAEFSEKYLYDFIVSYKKSFVEDRERAEAVIGSLDTASSKGVMFNSTYGKDNSKAGHGIYAEEAGSLLDKLSGEDSTVVGRDNAKNGPDKIVNSSQIQCKYCKKAYNSVDACFKKNPKTGLKTFSYYDLNNNPMKVEVPADQYLDAIQYMKKRILNGQVEGVSDPEAAYSIIRKGKLTYNQALNLAKAGTIESISYDAATGAVNCLSVFGVSAIVSFAQFYWVTKDYKKAAKSAILVGLQVYGLSFVSGIIASQISRTSLSSALNPLASEIANRIGPNMTQEIINAFRALAGKKAIYGAAAQKSFTKFLGSTIITQSIMIVAFSIPDTYRMVRGKISGAQYFKNLTTLLASIGGNIAASVGTGALLGKKFGDKLDNKKIKIISIGAGSLGGLVVGTTYRGTLNFFREDDLKISMRLFNALLQNQVLDNIMSSEEVDELIEHINDDETILKKLLQKLVKSKTQEQDIIDFLNPKIELIINKRERIGNDDEERMKNSIASVILNEELEDEEDEV